MSSRVVPFYEPNDVGASRDAVVERDRTAFIESLYAEHAEFLSRAVYRLTSAQSDVEDIVQDTFTTCLLYTSPSPRDATLSRMPSSA